MGKLTTPKMQRYLDMMILISIVFSFLATGVFGQIYDSVSSSNSLILIRQEIDFLNNALKNSRDTFDFANKKVAFVTGSNGGKLISKQEYFSTCVKPWTDVGSTPQIFFIHLTNDEKQKSGGYDVLVFSWVKVFTPKQRKSIIEQLNRKITSP